jgi:hypothetical protein
MTVVGRILSDGRLALIPEFLMNRFFRRCALWLGALLLPVPLWSQSVVINEIHYDEDDPTVHSEFIELHNPGAVAVPMGGWYFSDGVPFVFPAGTVLSPGGYLVVCEDPATLRTKWLVEGPSVLSWNAGVMPPVYGRLRNSGDTLVLRAAGGAKVDEVAYSLGFPWPTVGDPPNLSIELIHPGLDNNLAGSWRRSDGGRDAAPAQAFISRGSTGWRYRKAVSEPSDPIPAWRAVDFVEDASWLSSAAGAPFGYPASSTMKTVLSDMRMTATQTGYTGIHLRHSFQMAGPAPGPLKLRIYSDDGCVAWLNGQEIARFGPAAGTEVTFDAVAGRTHAASAVETVTLSSPNALLNIGTPSAPALNVLSLHALNAAIGDADFSIDAELKFDGDAPSGSPTPLAANSVLAANPPPAIRQVGHAAVGAVAGQEWPRSGQDVRITAKVTDPEGVAGVALSWQVVEPGDYIKRDDARYEAPASWTRVLMRDDGQQGDRTAGDAVYSALIPAAVQAHRRLIRYRLTAVDSLNAAAAAPRLDDPQPNFAYFVHDGVPAWTGKAKPTAPEVTYAPSVLTALPVYHLVTRIDEHANAQQVPVIRADGTNQNPVGGAYTHSLYNWHGALCYDGRVYDHIRFRARGGVWRFAMGKNMWKFDFNRGHDFQARDDYGRPYGQKWKKLNFSACIQQGDFNSRGEHGLYESVGFRLFQLTGMPAEHTQYVHFRIVERPSETNGTPGPFDDDFQGLYLAIEQQDGQFLDEHGLPDGNLYKMESGTGELNHTGPLGPKNKSDLNAFIGSQGYGGSNGAKLDWWRTNCDLENYYNYRAIVDCIHHYDIGDGKNFFYYRNPVTSQWTALPWDLDLTWDDGAYRADTGIAGLSPSGNTTEPFFAKVFGSSQAGAGPIPELRREMRNRVREVLDLLFTPEQTGMLIDEKAAVLYRPGQPGFADADRALWDYHPIMVSSFVNASKAGHGRFYARAANDPGTPENEAATFAGMLVKMKNYVAARRAVITSRILTAAEEALVPATPTLTRADGGTGPIPTDRLTFTSSEFTGREGASFAAMKWRLAEVTDPAAPGFDRYNRSTPRAYEITASWESEELSTFVPTLTLPAAGARSGGTYRARVKHKDSTGRWSHWSAPVQFTATDPDVQPYREALVVSQFLYNPSPPTPGEAAVAADAQEYEWIELMNVGAVPLDLTPIRLTKGVDFDFAGSAVTLLPAGGRVLVVKNPAAFAARYGAGFSEARIAGTWQSGQSLSNAGEEIKVSHGAGTLVRAFVYSDESPWPDGADGTGHGLVLVDPLSLPDHAVGGHWRLSVERGGSPGASDAVTYDQWAAASGGLLPPEADPDGDGYANLAEYALGLPPRSAVGPVPLEARAAVEEGAAYFEVRVRQRLGADDVRIVLEAATPPGAWMEASAAYRRYATQPNGDGTATISYRRWLLPGAGGSELVRVRIVSAELPR